MLDYLLLVIGLAILIFGGDLLVRGAVGLAERLQIPALIIGLTIVAFGTSAPELFISVQAALQNAPGIAIGNVVGSNIANVLLVMGLPALIAPTVCNENGLGRNIVAMIAFTLVFIVMMHTGGAISRLEGGLLFVLLCLFVYAHYLSAKNAANGAAVDYHDEVTHIPQSVPIIWMLIIAGLILLPLGSNLAVDAASAIAERWQVPDAVIGLTIVALGTSLPELATALMATIRGSSSIAIGNVVGSNIFNIGSIMGIAALVRPLTVGERILQFDIWVMLACALLVAGLAYWCIKIGKRVGSAMVAAYVAFIVTAFMV